MERFLILTYDDDPEIERWTDSGEGPWNTYEDCQSFALAEVGAKWMIVRIEAADHWQTFASIDKRNRE